MKFSIQELRQCARDLLSFLNEENISGKEDLDGRIGHAYIPKREEGEHRVEVTLKPSNFRTRAHTISYKVGTEGDIPIELRINFSLKYFQILLKALEIVRGYKRFPIESDDRAGNIRQYKAVTGTVEMQRVKSELEELCEGELC